LVGMAVRTESGKGVGEEGERGGGDGTEQRDYLA